MRCLSIKVSVGINSMDLKEVKDSFCQIFNLIFDRTHLSNAEESLLCDYPMVIDYILEITLTKRQNVKDGFIQF